VTDVVYLLPLISLAADADGQVLTGHATIGHRQPWGPVTNRTPLLISVLRHDGTDSDGPRRASEVAGPSGLSAPAKRAGRKGRAGLYWRPDGR
jgi:hypothetical protein